MRKLKLLAIAILSLMIRHGLSYGKTPPFDLLGHLGFAGCELTQDEKSHRTQARGSTYAVDIQCANHDIVVGPKYLSGNSQYRVSRVGNDYFLGDYVTIDFTGSNGETLTLVYGHTSTTLKQGDKLKQGELLGHYSKSGKTTGPHTHIELWKGGKNISFDMRLINSKSERLKAQRGWIKVQTGSDLLHDTMMFILSKEGLRLEAYHDGGTRYSIGYGTPSRKGEKITQEEARKRMEKATSKRLDTMKSWFPNKTENQYIALTSYYYNCPSGVSYMTKHGINKSNRMRCVYADGKKLKGLVTRRVKERETYNGGQSTIVPTGRKCRYIGKTNIEGSTIQVDTVAGKFWNWLVGVPKNSKIFECN